MTTITLNDLTEGLNEATVREWYTEANATIKKGEPLIAFETAKAIMEAPAPFSGTVVHLHVKPGDKITRDQPLADIILN